MDIAAEVPEFKIAKVGRERKRRGAGLPWLSGGKGGGLFAGATGGSGAAGAGGLAGLLGKTMVLALVATLSAGAWQFGKSLRPDEGGPAKAKLFADKGGSYSEEDLANVLRSNNRMMPNSLGYVSGSLDAMTPEERARKEAEAAEAARRAEEEARKAEEEAGKPAADASVAGAPAGMDPNALMKGVAGDNKDKAGPFGKKFGALSSSLGGGGLAGGAGLAGGVGRGFVNPELKTKGFTGKSAAMRGGASPSISKAAKARPGASNNKGFARRQLSNAFALSRQASSASKPEGTAQTASQAFDNNTGAGNVISGPGVGNGSGAGGGDAGGNVNPTNGGGAINPNDEAAPIANQKGRNVTAYQGLVDIALVLLAIASLLSIILAVVKYMAWTPWGLAVQNALMMALMAIGAIVALLGVAIMAQGQTLQGGIIAISGVMTAGFAYLSNGAFAADTLAQYSAGWMVASAVSSLGGIAGGLMTGGKGGAGSMQ